jgi:methylaspartate ammonia-lyase
LDLFFQIDLTCWLLIYPKIDADRADNYVRILRQVAQQHGMTIDAPLHVEIDDDETDTYARALRSHLNEKVGHSMKKSLIVFSSRFNWYRLLLNHVESIVTI